MLPTHRKPTHPGEMLLEEFLKPLGIKQNALAKAIHKTPAAINELCTGKRGVTPEVAYLLAAQFETTPQFWMNLQSTWDLWHARRKLGQKVYGKKALRTVDKIQQAAR